MSFGPQLAYVQARMQSRYAQRPDTVLWSSLGQIESFGHYLQQAGSTGLGPSLAKLGADSSPHAVEICLREYFRHLASEISGWMPEPWRLATRWFGLLIDLEPIRIIAGGGRVPDWFQNDPFLGSLISEPATWPLPELAPLDAGTEGLADRWLSGWRHYCPDMTVPENRGLAALVSVLPVAAYDKTVVDKLERSFRHFSGKPLAVFSFLALVLSDLFRLRGELLKRIEFPGRSG